MTITRSSIPDELWPGLQVVFADTDLKPQQWKEIYAVHSSDKAVEYDVEMANTGLAQVTDEGNATMYDDMLQWVKTAYVNKRISLGFIITEEAIEDNLYSDMWPKGALALKDSHEETKNQLGAVLFNNAFNSAYPIGDGQPMCSLNHPVRGGVFSNTLPINAQLQEATLEDLLIVIDSMLAASGLKANKIAKKLLVPKELIYTAKRILGSTFQPDTGNNAINSLVAMNMLPDGFAKNNFLLSPYNYYILTQERNGFKHYRRKPLEADAFTDIDTNNCKVRTTERYSFNITNPRAVAGVQGV